MTYFGHMNSQLLARNRGPLFQVANLNRNLTQIMPSEIHYQRDPTVVNGSVDM